MPVELPAHGAPANEHAEQRTPLADDDWFLGNPSAPVTLLVYSDFECQFSGVTRTVLEQLVAEYPDLVKVVFRHFPIATRHPHAFAAAEAAEIAGAEGKFWQMHDMLFTHQRALEPEKLEEYAGALGLDAERFRAALSAHSAATEVQRDFQRGIRDRVKGTPTLFINGVRYVGARTLDMLREAVWAACASELGADGPSARSS